MRNKILIVDDETDIVSMLKDYFELNGYDTITAVNGLEAIQKAEKQPDIILLDINMPDIDGMEVCMRIRDFVSCPILFLTARIETSDKIKGFSVGADDYIIKPFSIDELGARVAAHLRRDRRQRESAKVRNVKQRTWALIRPMWIMKSSMRTEIRCYIKLMKTAKNGKMQTS